MMLSFAVQGVNYNPEMQEACLSSHSASLPPKHRLLSHLNLFNMSKLINLNNISLTLILILRLLSRPRPACSGLLILTNLPPSAPRDVFILILDRAFTH